MTKLYYYAWHFNMELMMELIPNSRNTRTLLNTALDRLAKEEN